MSKPSRRDSRENAFICLFAASFSGMGTEAEASWFVQDEELAMDAYMAALLQTCWENLPEIDQKITPKLKGWTLERLPRVSLQILRLATAEMLFGEEDLDSVVINEAVELAKKYGEEGDYQFINGILGNIVKELRAADTVSPPPAAPDKDENTAEKAD